MRKVVLFTALAILLSAFVTPVVAQYGSVVAWTALGTTRDQQTVDFTFHVIDSQKPVDSCSLTLYLVSDKGLVSLAEGTVINGTFSVEVKISRTYKSTVPDSGRTKDIYASVNFWVIAFMGMKVGNKMFSVDPSWLDWPESPYSVTIEMDKLPTANEGDIKQLASQQKLSVSSPPYPPYSQDTWKYTTVLQFSTWDQIWGGFDYPIGCKIRVESQCRYWNYVTGQLLGPWQTIGYTTVTIDDRVYKDPLVAGQKTYKLEFKFLYRYETRNYAPEIGVELVYAVDRPSGDPNGDQFTSSSWGGSMPPSYQDHRWISQGVARDIPVTGGDNYVWSVSVGFSIGPPWDWAVSVGLGVTKVAAPQAVLKIKAGTWTAGWKVHAVAPDGTWRQSYSKWQVES